MGAMDELTEAAERAVQPEPEPCTLLVSVESGHLAHPLPLPGGRTPEQWIAEAADVLGPAWASEARWTLVPEGVHAARPEKVTDWRPVAGTST